MTDLHPSAEVYAVLIQQPRWYGVPVKLVLYVLSGMLGGICLTTLALPGVVAKMVGCALSIIAAVGILVVIRRSGAVDPDLIEVVCRFLLYPAYMGPR